MIACRSQQLWANRWRRPPRLCDGGCEGPDMDWQSDANDRDVIRVLVLEGFTDAQAARIIASLRDHDMRVTG